MFPEAFRTARLILRPIAAEDAVPIFDTYAGDPEVARFLIWRPHQHLGDTQAYIARCITTSPDEARTYALTGREDGAAHGTLDLRQAGPHGLGFGYVLARSWWGQGLMTEALAEVVQWALQQPSVFRIGAVCDVENVGSARVMERAGLSREGLLRRGSCIRALAMPPAIASSMPACADKARRQARGPLGQADTNRPML